MRSLRRGNYSSNIVYTRNATSCKVSTVSREKRHKPQGNDGDDERTTVKAEKASVLFKGNSGKDSGWTLSVLCVHNELRVNQWLMLYAFRTGTHVGLLFTCYRRQCIDTGVVGMNAHHRLLIWLVRLYVSTLVLGTDNSSRLVLHLYRALVR